MQTKSLTVLSWVLLAGLSIGLLLLAWQNQQLAARAHAHEVGAIELQERITTLQVQLTELAGQVAAMERAMTAATQSRAASGPILAPDLPDLGIYILPAEVADAQTGETRRLTIYHLTTIVGIDDFSQQIHVGAATAGLMSIPRIYFDYDSDGRVDMGMARKFAEPLFDSIPGVGGLLSSYIDPDNAQAIYDEFLRSSGGAEFVPFERVAESGASTAQWLWEFVDSQSAEIAAWVEESLGGGEPVVR